jgi:TetR/AcrR family transcriptional regulator, transcriptional repressor for nem operon
MSTGSISALRTREPRQKTVPSVRSEEGSRDLRKGEATRERILSIAEAMVLSQGFGATSIEGIIAEAGLTKSGFFYHFRDKTELAREMLRRYVAANDRLFDDLHARAAEIGDDPLDVFLIWLKLLAGVMRDLPNGHPGCLIAAMCYEERQFDREIRAIAAEAVQGWNSRFLGYLGEVAAVHPPRPGLDLGTLARMMSCIVDGAIIMSKTLGDPLELERQVLAYRAIVRLAFAPA